MSKLKEFIATGLFVIGTSLLAPSAANAFIFVSGSACEAANLNQALQGIGWSQAGVKNNATTSLYVVCPLNWDTTNGLPAGAVALATFPGSTGVVECTIRVQSFVGGAYTSATFTVTAGQNGAGTDRGLNGSTVDFNAGNNATIVCALDPGEGIEYVRAS